MTDFPDVKLKVVPSFPSQVTGRVATTVDKTNGHWYVDHDVSQLAENNNISADQVAQSRMTIWNKETNSYQTVPYALAAGGGVSSIDGKTGALEIGNGLEFTGDTLEVDIGTGLTFNGSTLETDTTGYQRFETRALAVAATIATSVPSILIVRYATGYPVGNATYIPGTAAGPLAFQEAGGHWWELDDSGTVLQATWFGAKGDGIVDDTAAIQAAVDLADGREVHLADGTYSVSQIQRLTSVTDTFRNGMKLIGQGQNTILQARTSSKAVLLWDVGYVPDGTAAPTLKFTVDSEVRNLRITQAGGLTNVDGIRLTAAWHVKLTGVQVRGMSGYGMGVPWRADIYAAVSDNWQCFSFDIQHCRFSECTLWGVYFNGGQSPGLWKMQFCILANNAGGGIYSETGHFTFSDNLITSNGTFGGNGGMLVQGTEGQAMVATIERNEFDTCHAYFLWLLDCRNFKVTQNRFLSFTFASDTSLVFESGSAFMRPVNQVKIGDGTTGGGATINWNHLFEQNYHRSIYGAGPTTAACYGYVSVGGDQVLRNRFVDNDMHGRDGVTQNSSGFVRYSNINITDANRMEDNGLVQVVAQASGATAVAGTDTTVTFGTETVDNHTAFASGTTFTTPVQGLYAVNVSVTLTGLVDTNLATLKIKVGGTTIAQTERQASGTGDLTLQLSTTLLLGDTDSVIVTALQNSGSGKNTVTGAPTRLTISQVG